MSRLEVQVQVLAEQLHVLEGQLRKQKGQQASGQNTSRVSSDQGTVTTEAASVVELESENDSEFTGCEVVINPFFEGQKNPLFCDSGSEDARAYGPPFSNTFPACNGSWQNQAHVNSVIALQQLVAESDAEIARLSAQLGGNSMLPVQGYYSGERMAQTGVMHGNPVFDTYNPYQQGVLVA